MERQFTATAYVIDDEKVLLIYHKKHNKWLPPGGHLDLNELPSEGAIREVFEETGYHVELCFQENIWIKTSNASSFPRPYMCLLEEVPERPDHPAHQHMDFIYLAKLNGGECKANLDEVADMRWFSLDEIESLISEIDIFEETKQTVRKILNNEYDTIHSSCLI
jgi:ADP-ribose pyrophosphatase YjhB (NUDIX family)